jgi:hypothetical protein
MAETYTSDCYMPPDSGSLPGEVLAVLPTDAYLQLELAYKITCHAYSLQVRVHQPAEVLERRFMHAACLCFGGCIVLNKHAACCCCSTATLRYLGLSMRASRCRKLCVKTSRSSSRWSGGLLGWSQKCMTTSSGYVFACCTPAGQPVSTQAALALHRYGANNNSYQMSYLRHSSSKAL